MKIDDYLNELCSRLTVDPLRRDEIRLETHLHLRDRAEALRSEGLSLETADAQAVEEFGDAETVAASLNVRQPATSLANVIPHSYCLAAILIYTGFSELAPNAFSSIAYLIQRLLSDPFDLSSLTPSLYPFVVFIFFFFYKIIFGIALLRNRRWVRKPIILASLCMILFLLVNINLFFRQNHSISHANPILSNIFFIILIRIMPDLLVSVYALWAMLDLRRSRAFSRS